MKFNINTDRVIAKRDEKIFGHFLEHFENQIYGGIYDPSSKFADEDGFRTDVIEAIKKIKPSVIRWPGGCFVSAYDWRKGVGQRVPAFDKAWRVEDTNEFGTDEFVKFCKKVECEPYICTNAGTGTPEEMSDWLEYCNLEDEGYLAKQRIENGYKEPHGVPYWSIGNENYGPWEIGAKEANEWGRYVVESLKMMRRVDPSIELSAAALADIKWNINLLTKAGYLLDWISIHEYWDGLWEDNTPADYEACMAYTQVIENAIIKVKGILDALGLQDKISIAFDEWNLRSWHHPNIHHNFGYVEKEEYLYPRKENDDNSTITMADAVFAACFLNTCLRNAESVKMANFAALVNTRGAIAVYEDCIVKRSTYHVFDLYANYMYDTVIDIYTNETEQFEVSNKLGKKVMVDAVDVIATKCSETGKIAISAINKHPEKAMTVEINISQLSSGSQWKAYAIVGNHKDDYNDIGKENICIKTVQKVVSGDGFAEIKLAPHSVNAIMID